MHGDPANLGREGTPPGDAYDRRIVINDRREDVESLQQSLLSEMSRRSYDETSCFAIRLGLEEALSNAFRHGNKGDPAKSVTVALRVDPAEVTIEVEDQGEGFDPAAVPDPTENENIEIPSGRGIVLMRAFLTDVQIHPPGNRVSLRFRKKA
jgi:serine/threonine-protein kinase RsbW